MSSPSIAEVEAFHEFLADHFIMWRDLEPPGPPGEWFCSCGLKFGFSDSAIHHVAGLLAAREAAARAEALRGILFRVETACDGYSHLMDEDVPGGVTDLAAYEQGAADAAEAIRAAARIARTDGAGS